MLWPMSASSCCAESGASVRSLRTCVRVRSSGGALAATWRMSPVRRARASSFQNACSPSRPSGRMSMSARRRASSATSALAESIKSIGLYDAVPPTTVAILGLHDDERRAPIGSGSSRGDFPPREIPSDATQNDFSGLELYDAGAEPRAGDGRLGVPVRKRDEAALPDDTSDPGREKVARRRGDLVLRQCATVDRVVGGRAGERS